MAKRRRAGKVPPPSVLFGASSVKRLSRFSFPALAGLVAVASFAFLILRGRPADRFGAVQPLLVASGFHQPRGLAFAPDGTLYVAEAGLSTTGEAPDTGRVSSLSPSGTRAVIADGLPAASGTDPLFSQGGPAALVRGPSGGDTASFLFLGPTPESALGSVLRLLPGAPQWHVEPLASLGDRLDAAPGAPAAPWGGA